MEKNRTLSEKSTETYEKLRQAGAKNTTAFESINKMNREDKGRDKRRAIRSAPLSAEPEGNPLQKHTEGRPEGQGDSGLL